MGRKEILLLACSLAKCSQHLGLGSAETGAGSTVEVTRGSGSSVTAVLCELHEQELESGVGAELSIMGTLLWEGDIFMGVFTARQMSALYWMFNIW